MKMSRNEWLTFVSDICCGICFCIAIGVLVNKIVLFAVIGVVAGILLAIASKKFRDRKATAKKEEEKPEEPEANQGNG